MLLQDNIRSDKSTLLSDKLVMDLANETLSCIMKLDIEKFNRMLYIYIYYCFATKLFIMCRDLCYELWLEFNIYRNV